ncbi:DUF1311 domain-containing protein [Chromatiaceae bacterium AAb-1]|nr:DUF1311 domain-containing protein [Chromatiaceae bacterium AAb-1]
MNKYIAVMLAILSFSALASEESIDCENAMSTLEINQCALMELNTAKTELTRYLDAGYQRYSDDPELIDAIKTAQENWQTYAASHCQSVYTQWREGTIRGVMALSCQIKLTKQRTYEVWESFLTYMDDSPPVLPEPEK